MKAIEINYYLKNARPILHTDVVQIKSLMSNRHFLCRHCGADWYEHVNGRAQVIEDKDVEDNISEYYPDYLECKSLSPSRCKHYTPATYACCATCAIGRYCNGICDNFDMK